MVDKIHVCAEHHHGINNFVLEEEWRFIQFVHVHVSFDLLKYLFKECNCETPAFVLLCIEP